MSRSGTTWLGKCLNMHPDAATIGETLYWGRSYVEADSDGYYGQKQIREVVWRQKNGTFGFFGNGVGCLKVLNREKWSSLLDDINVAKSRLTPAEFYEEILQRVAFIEGKPRVIEKTPHHINHIARILESLGDSKFVLMVRDPYSFMLSYKNQGLQQSVQSQQSKSRFYHPLGCAIIWKSYARQAMLHDSDQNHDTLLVRFEELKERPCHVWKSVLKFMDLHECVLPEVNDTNTSFLGIDRPKLTSVDFFWMNLISGRMIRELDYQKVNTKLDLIGLIRSFFALIPWVWHVLRVIPAATSGSFIAYAFNWLRKGQK
jgi:hypothetical protein